MVTVPLGVGAYKRTFAGSPEIRCENRFLEQSPSNLHEKIILLGRPGTNPLVAPAGGTIRGCFSKQGFLNGDLFIVSGHNFYRYGTNGLLTQITGTIAGDGNPYMTWMKGIGYENLFVSDGSTLQYFNTHAKGTLTLSGNIDPGGSQVIDINGVYYGWNANVDANSPAGTSTNPYWALAVKSGVDQAANNTQSLAEMVLALNNSGTPGLDYSSAITSPNTSVTATSDELHLYLTAIDATSAGNAITTSVFSGSGIAFGGANLSGGGGTALASVTGMGGSEVPKALANLSSYVLVSVGNSQKFYWINPGEVVIDPLNFAEKESNPDNILDMLTVGDQVLIAGNGSTENWYATGNFATPFAPIEGRVYARGVLEGTPVVVNDSVFLVGNDGVVYEIGYSFGTSAQWGVHRVSDSGIEERIRTQTRLEQGLQP